MHPQRGKTAKKSLIIGTVISLLLVGAGFYFLSHSRAAGSFLSVEAENGSLSAGAVAVADTSASGSRAVGFAAAATPSPTPTPTPTPGAVVPLGVSGTWTLKFADEFNGTAIDTAKWNLNEGKSQNGVTNHATNVAVSGGSAIMTLAAVGNGAMLSSGQVDGIGSNHYQLPVGGYAEARVYFPGSGSSMYNWPAWWLVGSPAWPAHGENDIAEVAAWKSPSPMSVNYHGPGLNEGFDVAGTWSNAYHVYGAFRKAASTDFYYDGKLVKTLATNDDDIPQSLVFNNGLYSGQAGTFGAAGAIKIDYARAWQ